MPTSNYPTSLDTTSTQVTPISTTDLDASGFEHDLVHGAASTALIALQTKLGISATPAASAAANSIMMNGGSPGTTSWSNTITGSTIAGTTLTGAVDGGAQVISNPVVKDYGETVNIIGATGGGTQDIDITLGNVVQATVDTSTNTFTFSNPSATGVSCSFTLILTNGGSQTVVWPLTVDWAAATAPTLTAAGVDVLTFMTVDAGVIWYGFAGGLAMA
tara:strand:+ start:3748 stop:4401 length:654 start_codon:yes stop_codon:yes gene_type:complete